MIVTSDHGEALFEDGVLGHGLALDEAQTRVPLVVSRPRRRLAGADRALRHARGAAALARASRAEPSRRARASCRSRAAASCSTWRCPSTPRLLCLRGLDTELRYDTTDPANDADPGFRELIWWWESVQLEAAAREPRALAGYRRCGSARSSRPGSGAGAASWRRRRPRW